MSEQMEEMNDMFSDMGAFSSAFGMDQLSFGEFNGYFGIECGNVLGIGGAIFAAIIAVTSLAKEEKDRTAEFLLTHPIKRTRILTSKLISVFAQIVIMNIIVNVLASITSVIIGESEGLSTRLLLALAPLQFLCNIARICPPCRFPRPLGALFCV